MSRRSPNRSKLSKTLRIEEFEPRVTPVLANNALAPLVPAGTGYDGVVLITSTIGGQSFTGTGFLLPTGRHILTAAHNFTNKQNQIGLDKASTVSFDMPTVGRVNIDVPPSNIVLNPGYAGGVENDLAVMTLPVLAPSGPAGTLGAERYPIYRNTDEVGQIITIVGYGTIGTGTTGQQTNEDLTKRITRNKYDTVGDRVNFGGPQALLYDFDNGTTNNDAFGRILGLNDTGLPDEGTSGQGDSGGPVFITINGQRFVAGTTTSGPNEQNPENPAVLNPAVQAGFGSISHDTRMSFHAGWIDSNSVQPAAEALDLRVQVVGADATPDAISVRVVNGNLELVVNGNVYQSIPVAGVTALSLTGAGADGSTFTSTATIEASVPLTLTISYQRILTVNDQRTSTTTNPPASAPPIPPTLPRSAPIPLPSPPLDLNTFPNAYSPNSQLAVGAGAGQGRVQVIDTANKNTVIRDFQPFPGFTGGISVGLGDVTGDFVAEVVTGAGVGGGPRVQVSDMKSGSVIRDFFAYEDTFRGGVNVAAGDVNGDGVDDIVIGAGVGGGPRVRVFDGTTGKVLQDFFAYEESFRGGVTVTVGDVNDDGMADIVTGAGVGGSPRVRVFRGDTGTVIKDFFAYEDNARGGVFVAVGDVNGDGAQDIVTGSGKGGGPRVRIFDAVSGNAIQDFFAYDSTFLGGVRVAVADADDDGLSDIVVAAGEGTVVRPVLFFQGDTTNAVGLPFTFDSAFLGGIFVGGQP